MNCEDNLNLRLSETYHAFKKGKKGVLCKEGTVSSIKQGTDSYFHLWSGKPGLEKVQVSLRQTLPVLYLYSKKWKTGGVVVSLWKQHAHKLKQNSAFSEKFWVSNCVF